MGFAFVFPGQGSQSLGMQQDLAAAWDVVQSTYSEASEILGYDLWERVQGGPVEQLNRTVVTQPAMLAAGVAAWRAWLAAGGVKPQLLAGHSLGEYTALVCADAVDFVDAVRLVERRSQLMQDAVAPDQGAMAAILGLDDAAILEVCEGASGIGVAEAVNFNSPGQVVVAGHRSAIERLIELAREHGARRAIMLPVSVPSHSSLMRPAGEALADSLASANFREPSIPVINAVDANPYTDADDIRQHLKNQVFSPVRWVDTVKYILSQGVSAVIECGPGKVLTGLNRRIARDIATGSIENPESLQEALQLTLRQESII